MALLLEYAPLAEKDLFAVEVSDRERITRRLEAFAAADGQGFDVRSVIGEPGLLRLRVGDWRVMFVRRGDQLHVRRVLNRKEAYR